VLREAKFAMAVAAPTASTMQAKTPARKARVRFGAEWCFFVLFFMS
jgi:hypothetical protein